MSYGRRQDWLKRKYKDEDALETSLKNKKIVLFDMDGTLTEPREPFKMGLLPALFELGKKATIGIVSGSDMDYIQEQLGILLSSGLRKRIHLLPCNGTKYYKPSENSNGYELFESMDMKKTLGPDMFKQIMISLIQQQREVDFYNLPLTGHFISYRGSMINWCPIGRNANDKERKIFVDYDKQGDISYREKIKDKLQKKMKVRGVDDLITIKLGGSTSFDIYPNGWDKTYSLKHFPNYEVWFVGDKCTGNGNDKELYDLLLKDKKSFETKSTENTKLIIENSIIPEL